MSSPHSQPLSADLFDVFHRDGVVVARGFYDLKNDIEPIQRHIHSIIGALISQHGLPIEQLPFSADSFDYGYQKLIAIDRKLGSAMYDAVKQIPAFGRLASTERHEWVMKQLRGEALPGIDYPGYGIRIDNPSEGKFLAQWHQEYPFHPRSLDGLVFWSPLVPVDEKVGPVRFCVGSHRSGLFPMHSEDVRNRERTGSYAMTLANEEALVAKFEQIAPLTNPGDLVIIDFRTLHASSPNTSERSRWAMTMRWFNYLEPTGMSHGWKGSFNEGIKLEELHPELVLS